MEIEALGKKWEINGINYKPRRKLHAIHAQAYVNAVLNKSNEIVWDKYYDALEIALSIAFDDVENSTKGLTDTEIDALGQVILNKYFTIEKKANGGVV